MLTNLRFVRQCLPVVFLFVSFVCCKENLPAVGQQAVQQDAWHEQAQPRRHFSLSSICLLCWQSVVLLSSVVCLGLCPLSSFVLLSAQAPTSRQFRQSIQPFTLSTLDRFRQQISPTSLLFGQSFAKVSPSHHPAHPVSAELFGRFEIWPIFKRIQHMLIAMWPKAPCHGGLATRRLPHQTKFLLLDW